MSIKLVKILILSIFAFLITACCCSKGIVSSSYMNGKYIKAEVAMRSDANGQIGLLTLDYAKRESDFMKADAIVYAVHAPLDTVHQLEDVVYINFRKLDDILLVDDVRFDQPDSSEMKFGNPTVHQLKLYFGEYLMNYHSAFAEDKDHDDTNHKRGHVNTQIKNNYKRSGLNLVEFKEIDSGETLNYYTTMDFNFGVEDTIYVNVKEISHAGALATNNDTIKILIIKDVLNNHHFPH